MYNKKLLRFQIISTIFTILLGTLLHFTFELSNKNLIIGAFSAVNESTWEHLKLLFFPMLISTIVGCFYIGKSLPNYLCGKVIGIICALLFTTIFFYTYTGILGTNIDILNIALFVFSAILGEYIAYKIILSKSFCNKNIAITFLVILFVCFIIFTYFTPQISLFKDPISR